MNEAKNGRQADNLDVKNENIKLENDSDRYT